LMERDGERGVVLIEYWLASIGGLNADAQPCG